MASVKLLNLQVSDIIQWFRAKELVVNDVFQRRAVWTSAAKTFLIDTILREMPIPKIYIRTKIDSRTQKSIREIVDGQQRIRALVEFANGELRLSKRAGTLAGSRYEELTDEQRQTFLGYTIAVDQLLNASNDDVLEIFARLNSYNVTLNAAEKRHAEFQTEFKWVIRAAALEWKSFFERHEVLTLKQRFRMLDDQLMAEMFGVILEGVEDGGAPRLRALYKKYDDDVFTSAVQEKVHKYVTAAHDFLDNKIGDALNGEFAKPYHVLMLFAAFCHLRFGIPRGQVTNMPDRHGLAEAAVISDRLARLEEVLQLAKTDVPARYREFIEASSSSTHRISSRKVRFHWMTRVMAA